jgi:hypothetical protein
VIPVVGVLAGNTAEQAAYMLANFGGPDEVPVLDRHLGTPVGWIRAVMPDGPNVWFSARVHDATLAERIRRGPVPVSMEIGGLGVKPVRDGISVPFLIAGPAYRGNRFRPGWVLLAVAVLGEGEQPLRPGSALWAATT